MTVQLSSACFNEQM